MRLRSFFLAILFTLLIPSTVSSSIPAFNKTLCTKGAGLSCLVPDSCEDGQEFVRFVDGPSKTPAACDMQVIIRAYTEQKMSVEMWGKHAYVYLMDHEGKKIFGCASDSDGQVKPVTDDSDAKLQHVSGATVGGLLYCRFQVTKTSDIIPKPFTNVEGLDARILISDRNYTTTASELRSSAEFMCNPDIIKPESSSGSQLAAGGYHTAPLSEDALFAKQIKCPQDFELAYIDKGAVAIARSITCKMVARKLVYEITPENGAPENKDADFVAGCRRKVCDMCGEPSFSHDQNGSPTANTADGCTKYTCPKGVIEIDGEKRKGTIECAKTKDSSFAWALGGDAVNKAKCSKKRLCHVLHPLGCKDADCPGMTDRKKSPVKCKGKLVMSVVSGGTVTAVDEIFCGEKDDRYMQRIMDKVDTLTDEALVECAASSAAATEGQPAGAQVSLVVVGGAVGGVIIVAVIAIIVCCCIKKRRSQKEYKTTKRNTETTTTNNSKTSE
ncbi:hypothetical protein PFISCL1PPCAC_7657, partial [Pristionchus fissidentatus]